MIIWNRRYPFSENYAKKNKTNLVKLGRKEEYLNEQIWIQAMSPKCVLALWPLAICVCDFLPPENGNSTRAHSVRWWCMYRTLSQWMEIFEWMLDSFHPMQRFSTVKIKKNSWISMEIGNSLWLIVILFPPKYF